MKNRFSFEEKIIRFVTKRNARKGGRIREKGKNSGEQGLETFGRARQFVFVCISPLRVIYCEPGEDRGQDKDEAEDEDEAEDAAEGGR